MNDSYEDVDKSLKDAFKRNPGFKVLCDKHAKLDAERMREDLDAALLSSIGEMKKDISESREEMIKFLTCKWKVSGH